MPPTDRDAPRPPSLVRSVLPPVLFLLVCGVVGPIFLVMGIVAGDAPEAGWLLPTGIGITALDLVIGLLLGRGRYRSAQKSYRLHQRGRRGRATVLSFDQTGVRINDEPLIALRLRIHGDDIAPFEVESKTVIPDIRMPLLYAGDLPVLVDPESGEWQIDWDSAPIAAPIASVSAAGPGDARPVADRLAELDDLLRRDLVSREEYDAKRASILDEV